MESSPRKHGPLESPVQGLCPGSSTAIASPRAQPSLAPPPPILITRSDPDNPYPTTFVHADPSTFKQVVQMLTGSSTRSDQTPAEPHNQSITPIKSVIPRKTLQPGFRLYQRRSSVNKLSLSPLVGFVVHPSTGPSQSHRYPDVVSPSVLDFPSLALSPVTPLMPDPFAPPLDMEAEEKAIKEKGFFLHPSPRGSSATPEPRLLPLFPETSRPLASGSC